MENGDDFTALTSKMDKKDSPLRGASVVHHTRCFHCGFEGTIESTKVKRDCCAQKWETMIKRANDILATVDNHRPDLKKETEKKYTGDAILILDFDSTRTSRSIANFYESLISVVKKEDDRIFVLNRGDYGDLVFFSKIDDFFNHNDDFVNVKMLAIISSIETYRKTMFDESFETCLREYDKILASMMIKRKNCLVFFDVIFEIGIIQLGSHHMFGTMLKKDKLFNSDNDRLFVFGKSNFSKRFKTIKTIFKFSFKPTFKHFLRISNNYDSLKTNMQLDDHQFLQIHCVPRLPFFCQATVVRKSKRQSDSDDTNPTSSSSPKTKNVKQCLCRFCNEPESYCNIKKHETRCKFNYVSYLEENFLETKKALCISRVITLIVFDDCRSKNMADFFARGLVMDDDQKDCLITVFLFPHQSKISDIQEEFDRKYNLTTIEKLRSKHGGFLETDSVFIFASSPDQIDKHAIVPGNFIHYIVVGDPSLEKRYSLIVDNAQLSEESQFATVSYEYYEPLSFMVNIDYFISLTKNHKHCRPILIEGNETATTKNQILYNFQKLMISGVPYVITETRNLHEKKKAYYHNIKRKKLETTAME